MNIRELLEHPSLQLPITRNSDDFQGFVESLLSRYTTLLDSFSDPHDVASAVSARRKDIETFCSKAPEIVRATFAGHPQDAYQSFVEGIEPLRDIVAKHALKGLAHSELGLMYRVRRELKSPLTREDLFHIPFEKRHLVATQRYSIPGLPCIYLGGSLFTCWAEMGRPPFHELHASAFWLDKDHKITILNLSNRPKRLFFYTSPDGQLPDQPEIRELLTSFLILWPLVALCSIIVKYPQAPYKPEYIIPQIVLQWITKQDDYDGICYFSTHVNAVTTDNPLSPCNLVFPARNIASEGRCHHLRMRLRMTTPHNWQLLSAINAGAGGTQIWNYDFEFVEGIKEPYANTEFGRVQSKLNKLVFDAWRNAANNEGQVLP